MMPNLIEIEAEMQMAQMMYTNKKPGNRTLLADLF